MSRRFLNNSHEQTFTVRFVRVEMIPVKRGGGWGDSREVMLDRDGGCIERVSIQFSISSFSPGLWQVQVLYTRYPPGQARPTRRKGFFSGVLRIDGGYSRSIP
ncbi:MAG: hypothetical protein ACLTZT_15275 [Butyricimonas faecalis]